MKILFYKLLLPLLTLLIITFFLLSNSSFKKFCCSSEYKMFNSPNSNHYIKVYRYSNFYSIMPGSSGDAPGYIRLYSGNNVLKKEKNIDMVQLADTVEWSADKVIIKFIAEWELSK